MAEANTPPTPGQRVLLTGTGKWWAGAHWPANVVDFRESDKTVKVQYMDGGYKRFSTDDFNKFTVPDGSTEDIIFGKQEYEFSSDDYNPAGVVGSELEDLQEKMHRAKEEHDFQKAHCLQQQLEKRQQDMREAKRLQNDINMAIHKKQFASAHKLQQDLDKLNSAPPQPGDEPVKAKPSLQEQLKKAGNRALGGGTAGAMAMVLQVGSLMWMRTAMNYQYRYGTSTTVAIKTLYADGGILRFYRGIGPALIQGPLSRFGDTAANVGMLALLDANESTASLPIAVKTIGASASAASFRIVLTPVDTVKTIMQVEGKTGVSKLMAKVKVGGPTVFFHGGVGAAAATFAGHYPWWATYNYLDANLPVYNDTLTKLGRNAGLGFTSSVVSDTVSNSLRVLKTYRQTSETPISYGQAAKNVIAQDGVIGLFGRGLKTRILTNGAQATMFSVLWKYFDEKFNKKK